MNGKKAKKLRKLVKEQTNRWSMPYENRKGTISHFPTSGRFLYQLAKKDPEYVQVVCETRQAGSEARVLPVDDGTNSPSDVHTHDYGTEESTN